MDSKTMAVIAIAIIVVAGAGAYLATSGGDDSSDGPKFIKDYVPDTAGEQFVDAAGRTVTVPDQLGYGIVTLGSNGPLRFATVFDVYDLIIEVDKGDALDKKNGRAYSYAYDFTKHPYHADKNIDAKFVEDMGVKKPSLVITSASIYSGSVDLFKSLEQVTTVVVLEEQSMTSMGSAKNGLDAYMENNFNMLGKVFGQEERADEIISGLEAIFKDLDSLKGRSSDSVYVAGVTYQGSNTLNCTFPKYMPFDFTGNKNAFNDDIEGYRATLNLEDVAKLDIDMIVVDPSSSDRISYEESQLFMKYIYGLNTDNNVDNDVPIFITVPIVWDSINYDSTLASAYYITSITYGTLTHEEAVERINSVFTLFYGENGKNVLSDMSEFFAGKSSDNGQVMPMLGEVKIQKDGDKYKFIGA